MDAKQNTSSIRHNFLITSLSQEYAFPSPYSVALL